MFAASGIPTKLAIPLAAVVLGLQPADTSLSCHSAPSYHAVNASQLLSPYGRRFCDRERVCEEGAVHNDTPVRRSYGASAPSMDPRNGLKNFYASVASNTIYSFLSSTSVTRFQHLRDSYQSYFWGLLMRRSHDSEEEGERIPMDSRCGPRGESE